MKTRARFVKAYTRDFSIIMEEAWYYALSKGLWKKLGLQPLGLWPNFYCFNKGIIEVGADHGIIKLRKRGRVEVSL